MSDILNNFSWKLLLFLLLCPMAWASEKNPPKEYSLSNVIDFALKNNPGIISGEKDVAIENHNIQSTQALILPRVDFSGGYANYKYKTPATPVVFGPQMIFPEVDRNIYSAGLNLRWPLYAGGRLSKGIEVSKLRKMISEDQLKLTRNELVFNLTAIYYKIIFLEKLVESNEAAVRQLEAHKKNVSLFLSAGTVAREDLLKTDVELAHGKEGLLSVRNIREDTYELLKTFMGLNEMNEQIIIAKDVSGAKEKFPLPEESIKRALSLRPDYQALLKRKTIAKNNIAITRGKRYPDISLSADYSRRAGSSLDFKENWMAEIRLTMPLWDWGITGSEMKRGGEEYEKIEQEERGLRINIVREVKNAYREMETAGERLVETEKGIEAARETLRIEELKYNIGSGTGTDLLEAQAALLRAETDYYQALYDQNLARALLKKAVGE